MASPYCYVNLCPPPPPCAPLILELCTTEVVPVIGLPVIDPDLNNSFTVTFITKFLRCGTDLFPGAIQNSTINVDVSLLPTLQDRKIMFPVSFGSNVNASKMSGNVVNASILTNRIDTSVLVQIVLECKTRVYDLNPGAGIEVYIAPFQKVSLCPDCTSVPLPIA
jgi:hypothetical protein